MMKKIQKGKNKTRQSGSDIINYLRDKAEKDLEIRKEENNMKLIQEGRLGVSSKNQFQSFGQVINEESCI